MPHVVERARSSRAKCRGCGLGIAAGAMRFGERLANPYAEGEAEMTHWFHVPCAAFLRPEAFLEVLPAGGDQIEDRARLEREARLGVAHRRLPRATTAERAPSGRATCRACREAIDKGAWRVALVYYQDGRFAPAGFIHLSCAKTYLETAEILERVRHFSPALTDADLSEFQQALSNAGTSPG